MPISQLAMGRQQVVIGSATMRLAARHDAGILFMRPLTDTNGQHGTIGRRDGELQALGLDLLPRSYRTAKEKSKETSDDTKTKRKSSIKTTTTTHSPSLSSVPGSPTF
jgi:hypothetical protein